MQDAHLEHGATERHDTRHTRTRRAETGRASGRARPGVIVASRMSHPIAHCDASIDRT